MGRGANLYIKHELIDCIPVYHALYSHFDTFKLIERQAGAELGQAQLKLELGLTSTRI